MRYRPGKGKPDSPAVLEWSGAEFVGRIAALIPPARKHLVRYYGALGPRSPLRRAVSQAARQKADAAELESGYSVTALGEVARATCIKRVFEVVASAHVAAEQALNQALFKECALQAVDRDHCGDRN